MADTKDDNVTTIRELSLDFSLLSEHPHCVLPPHYFSRSTGRMNRKITVVRKKIGSPPPSKSILTVTSPERMVMSVERSMNS